MDFESGYSQLPVTALAFATDTVLLASDGGSLCVYNTVSGKQIGKKENVIPFGRRIHGIHVHRQTSTPEMHYAVVVVHGAKAWVTVAVTLDNSSSSSSCKQAHLRVEHFEEMEDWIMAAHWVCGSRGRLLVALALAHNQVVVCDPQASGRSAVYRARCAEQSILYSAAFHGDSVDELVVAAGTVFNQVVVWRVKHSEKEDGDNKAAQIIHRLQGHAGVVFGVRFSADGQHMASVSDDRTVIAWDLASPSKPKRMFGHQARVWSCLILDSGVLVSASEDGTCRVWDIGSGMAVDSWRQCKKNVWALAASPNCGATAAAAVASGGADGSIRLCDVNATLKRRVEQPELLATVALPSQNTYIGQSKEVRMTHCLGDYARGFALVAEGASEVLVTDSGYVLLRAGGVWTTCYASDVLRGYSVTACAPAGDLVAVGMRDGSVLLLLLLLLPGRLADTLQTVSLHTSSVQCLILGSAAGGLFDMVSSDSLTVVWSVVDSVAGTCTKKAELVLPPGCQLASAAVDRERGWAVVGSANGGLYLFDLRDPASGAAAAAAAADTAQDVCGVPAIDPCVCWARAHGKHRLSSVAFASDSSFSLCGRASSARSCVVLTGGRDGLVQQFAVHIGNEDNTAMPEEQRPLPKAVQSARSLDDLHQKIVLTRIRSDRVTRGWVEQLIWTTVPQRRLVAVTFHGKRLVALDLGITQSDASQPLHAPVVLLSLVCAGGSKPWQLLHTPQGVRVGVVMRSQLRTHTFASASSACTRVLVPGGCATESRCVAVVRIGGGAVVVATGGDDGCVRLFHSINSIDRMEQQQQLIGAVQCHTSAIRCMRASGAYLFTGGSKCELRSWTVVGQPPLLVEHARAPPPLLIANGARVMDICVVHAETANAVIHVAAAYSDASIRLWRLDTKRKRFVCVAYDAAHTHCALSLASFCCSGDEGQPPLAAWWLVSGATNGQLAFWNVTRFIAPPPCDTLAEDEIGSGDLGPPALLKEGVHQSGVNSIDAVTRNKECARSGGGGGRATLATGGDDGSVAIWEFSSSSPPLLCLVARRADAHAAAVQHVALGEACVFSVASDQRLAAWAVRESRLELLRMTCTQVADPAAMALMPSSVVIVGMGTEVIHFHSD